MRRTPRDARRRALAQNFLVDRAAVDALAGAVPLDPGSDLVVELGAGTGTLTAALRVRAQRVVAIEIDPVWAAALRRRAAEWPEVEVVEADALRIRLPAEPFTVVASPPWNTGTAIVRRLLADGHGLRHAALLLQREAARRLAGGGRLPATWAPWFDLDVAGTVGRGAFRPVPAADGAILVITPRRPPLLSPAAFARHARLVDSVFAAGGATLGARLAAVLGRRDAARVTELTGLDPASRPAALDAAAWARLTREVTAAPR